MLVKAAWMVLAGALASCTGALAQPLEQNFAYGAPPDVLGNGQITRTRPIPAWAEAAAERRRAGGVRVGFERRRTAARSRQRLPD